MFSRILVSARPSTIRPLMIVPQARSISLNHVLRQEDQPSEMPERKPIIPGSRVYVSNLNYTTTWQALKSFIQENVDDVNVLFAKTLTYKDGKNTGGAIVTLETPEQAKAVIEKLNQVTLDGRNVVASIAKSKEEWEQMQANRPPREPREFRPRENREPREFRENRGPRQFKPRQPRQDFEHNDKQE